MQPVRQCLLEPMKRVTLGSWEPSCARIIFVFPAVLIVISAGVYAMFARDLSAARARLVGRSKTIETSFGTLEYAVMGEGTPMLVVHGAEGGFDQGIDMTGMLARARISAHRSVSFWLPALDHACNATTATQAEAYAPSTDSASTRWPCWHLCRRLVVHPVRRPSSGTMPGAGAPRSLPIFLPAGTSIRGGAVVTAMINSDFVAWAVLKLIPIMPGGLTRMMLGMTPPSCASPSPAKRREFGKFWTTFCR